MIFYVYEHLCFVVIQDDESLRRWKEQLLGSVDLNSVGGNHFPFSKLFVLELCLLA